MTSEPCKTQTTFNTVGWKPNNRTHKIITMNDLSLFWKKTVMKKYITSEKGSYKHMPRNFKRSNSKPARSNILANSMLIRHGILLYE